MAKYLCIWVRAYWFSVTLFSKWLPGDDIRFFVFWMAWFQQRNSSLLWNFSFKCHVHVTFKMAALWFLTMFSCNPPIAHCHPLLWGGGILVDHWSTISSFFELCLNKRLSTLSRRRWFEIPSRPLWRHCNGGDNPLPEPMVVCRLSDRKHHLKQSCYIATQGTNFDEIWIKIQRSSLKKILVKMSSAKWRIFCSYLRVC